MRTVLSKRDRSEGVPPSYETTTRWEGGSYQTYVTVHCIECGEKTELHWNTGGNHPDYVAKKFHGLGWQFDAYKPKHCICPECLTSRKETSMAQTPTPPKPATSANALNSASVTVPRTLSNDERNKIRHLLDHHFDDTRGRYIDGYSDQRIGEEVNVPWAAVQTIREAAYGTLRDDPILASIKDEITELRTELGEIKKQLHKMEDIKKELQKVEAQFTGLDNRVKQL